MGIIFKLNKQVLYDHAGIVRTVKEYATASVRRKYRLRYEMRFIIMSPGKKSGKFKRNHRVHLGNYLRVKVYVVVVNDRKMACSGHSDGRYQ